MKTNVGMIDITNIPAIKMAEMKRLAEEAGLFDNDDRAEWLF